MTDATCSNCRFWALMSYQPLGGPVYGNQGHHMDGSKGDCRRRSPRSDPTRENFLGDAVWPVTSRDDWCGEFEPRAKDLGQ